MKSNTSIKIESEWDILTVCQVGRRMAKRIGFDIVDLARIATAISELAHNIYQYAGVGSIYLQELDESNAKGILIIASDKGPGIENISKIMEDGFSTSGGLGAGLPGVKRLMDDFQITSQVGEGTIVKIIKRLKT